MKYQVDDYVFYKENDTFWLAKVCEVDEDGFFFKFLDKYSDEEREWWECDESVDYYSLEEFKELCNIKIRKYEEHLERIKTLQNSNQN